MTGHAHDSEGSQFEGPSNDAESPSPADHSSNVSVDAALELLVEERDRSTHDKRLLSADGLIDVAREFGVVVANDVINETTIEDLVEASCRTEGDPLIARALGYAAVGQLDLDEGRPPQFNPLVHNEAVVPVQCYLGAIEYLDFQLDAKTAPPADDSALDEARSGFLERTWSEAWQGALLAASTFEAQLTLELSGLHSNTPDLGENANVFALVVDSEGRQVSPFPTFYLWRGPFIEDRNLQHRIVPRGNTAKTTEALSGRSEAGEPDTFVEELFSEGNYPDRAVVAHARVNHIVAVLPLPPEHPEVDFRLAINPGIEGSYSIEIITGEGNHTSQGSLHANNGKGYAPFGIPNSFSRDERFFKASAEELLGDKRKQLAELTGEEASQSIVIIAKPTVSSSKASFRRSVLQLKNGDLSPKDFASRLHLSSDADSLPWLVQQGYITSQQEEKISTELLEIRRQEAERKRQMAEMGLGNSGYGVEMMRGGGSATFSSKSFGLHSGAGSSTGKQFDILQESRSPDPFSSPEITVIHQVSVPRGVDAEAAKYFAAYLARVTEQRSFEKDPLAIT